MKKKLTLTILTIMLLPFLFGVTAVFANTSTTTLTSSDGERMLRVVQEANKKLGVTDESNTTINVVLKPTESIDGGESGGNARLIEFKQDSNTIVFNKEVFDKATEDSRKKAMSAFVSSLQESAVSKQGQQTTIENMQSTSREVSAMLLPMVMDSTSADLFTAMKVVNPFLPIVRLIFGIGAIVITIALVGSTIMDLVFIGIPIFRENMQERGENKGGKIPFISSDAISVIQETEGGTDSSGGYRNAYLIYFKRRVLTYVIIAFCLLYLVVGELGGLISWLLNLGSGLM